MDLYSATYNEKHAFGEKKLKGPMQQGSGGALWVPSVLFFFVFKSLTIGG